LDVIETAIRNAFEKGDSSDRAFREKVYRSAFAALERALKANPGVTVEMAINRRKRLQATIAEIETEFIPAAPPVHPDSRETPDVAEAEAVLSRVGIEPEATPGVSTPQPAPAPTPAPDPVSQAEVAPAVEPAAGPAEPQAEPHAKPQADAGPAPAVDGETRRDTGPGSVAFPEVAAPPVSTPKAGTSQSAAPEAATPEIVLDGPARAPATTPVAPAVEARPAEPVVLAGNRRVEPRIEGGVSAAAERPAEGEVPPQRERVVDGERRRPVVAILVILALLALIGGGVWWAMQSGLFKLPQGAGQATPAQPAGQGEEYDPDDEPVGAPAKPGDADAQRNWINVFTPDDPTSVSTPSDAKADVMEEDGVNFLRIRSGSSGSMIVFDVGQGVLEQLAGKSAVFDIVARAEEGKETQISVSCNFGELGGCGRKRYAVGYEKGDFLFEVDLPGKRPGASGTIAINSDIANGGKAIDVFEIRASVAQ
jgi:hypothetical protein